MPETEPSDWRRFTGVNLSQRALKAAAARKTEIRHAIRVSAAVGAALRRGVAGWGNAALGRTGLLIGVPGMANAAKGGNETTQGQRDQRGQRGRRGQ